jgi:hypothetical protein
MGAENRYQLRWDCLERGCFNHKNRPKFAALAEAFPGRINFTDIDGIVEIANQFLMLEWKSGPMDIPDGQRILYTRLSALGVTIVVVAGDARMMTVDWLAFFHKGVFYKWRRSTHAQLIALIKRWVVNAQRQAGEGR